MKKIFIGIAIAVCLTACSNRTTKTETTEPVLGVSDTTVVVDSTVVDTLVVE